MYKKLSVDNTLGREQTEAPTLFVGEWRQQPQERRGQGGASWGEG